MFFVVVVVAAAKSQFFSCHIFAFRLMFLESFLNFFFKKDCKLAKSIATLFQRSLLCSPCSLSVGGNKACIQFRVFIELVNFHVPFAFFGFKIEKEAHLTSEL